MYSSWEVGISIIVILPLLKISSPEDIFIDFRETARKRRRKREEEGKGEKHP